MTACCVFSVPYLLPVLGVTVPRAWLVLLGNTITQYPFCLWQGGWCVYVCVCGSGVCVWVWKWGVWVCKQEKERFMCAFYVIVVF